MQAKNDFDRNSSFYSISLRENNAAGFCRLCSNPTRIVSHCTGTKQPVNTAAKKWHVPNLSILVAHGIKYEKYTLTYKIAGTMRVQFIRLF